jgi:predicted amino acid-binding ACT domain protein
MASAARSVWSRAKAIPIEHPFAFGFFISGFKTSFSDLLVQKVVERKEKVDWKRNAAFATFGFLYLGAVQYGIYVKLFGRVFPGAAGFAAKSITDKLKDARGIFTLGAQVVLDQCLHHPLLYFPIFYCTRELVMHEKPDLVRCMNEYRRNMKEDMIALWKVWVPSTIINFAFMPMWARIPFVAATSLVWTCILSAMRGGDVTHGEDMAGGAVTGATLTMLEEGFGALFTSPVELERDMNHIMVTASGPDKIGWVALLSRAVADAGGNITSSKMVRLGGEFIVLMHTSIPPEKTKELRATLNRNAHLKGLNVKCSPISRRKTGTYDAAVMGIHLRCVGADK